MATRIDDLLVHTAQDLKAGRAPLNPQFLDDHAVTFDEATDLAHALAFAIHVYRAALDLGLKAYSTGEGGLADMVKAIISLQGGPALVLPRAVMLDDKASPAPPIPLRNHKERE